MNPTRRLPLVTALLIAINCVAFFYLWLSSGFSDQKYHAYIYFMGLIPSKFLSLKIFSLSSPVPVALTPISAMFLHGGLLHLAGNMLYLWIFGNNVEDYLGHARFLVFYLVTGLAASAAHIIVSFGSDVPMVGASGAVAGVMGAYFVLWPRARIRTLVFLIIFITVIELPAVVVLGFWIFIQVIEGFGSLGRGVGIAFFAHIGGFFVGMALIITHKRKAGKVHGGRLRRIV